MSDYEKTRSKPEASGTRPLTADLQLTPQITLKRSLGRGGMGEVWLVQDSSVNFEKAVKFLSRDLLHSERACDQFASTFANVQKYLSQEPNICVLHSFTRESEWGPWFLMRYIRGWSLKEFVKSKSGPLGRLDPVLTCILLTQAARALDRAHRSGILHRDIKPQNLMVEVHPFTASITVQIIDFGLAACLREPEHEANSFRGRGGTRGYRSPEQQEGLLQTKAADQYALAVVAFELLMSRLPFTGDQRRPNDPIENIPADSHLHRVFQKALSWNAGDRFDSCSEFVAQLQRSLGVDDAQREGVFSSYCGVDFGTNQSGETNVASPWLSPGFLTDGLPDDSGERLRELDARRRQLEDVRDKLRAEQEELNGPVRVGICGTRNSGKSTLLACWYLFRNSPADKLDIVIRDQPTRAYLERISQELLRNGFVSATADSANPKVLHMTMSFRGRKWEIETRDFAGEHLDFRRNTESAFADQTLKFLRYADMVLVLYDMTENSPEILNTFDSLYTEPLNDLVLVLTKFDQFHDGPIEQMNFPVRYEELRQRYRLLIHVDAKLRNSYASNGLKVIPVSSTGQQLPKRVAGDDRSDWVRLESLHPFQIFVPLASAFQRRVQRISRNSMEFECVSESLRRLEELVRETNRRQQREADEFGVALQTLEQEKRFADEQEKLPQTSNTGKTLLEAKARVERLLKQFPPQRAAERAACQELADRYSSRLRLLQQLSRQQDLDTERSLFDSQLEDLQMWVSSPSQFLYHLFDTNQVLEELEARLQLLQSGPYKSIYAESRRKLQQARLGYKRRWWQLCLTVSGSIILFFLYVLWF
jgi:serine/threonine protein kinase